jgi:hypothetical protein
MGWNVPDDWGSYYRRCDRCGSKYHASEGGCGCMDDVGECQCGQCNWRTGYGSDTPRCRDCGTGPYVEGRSHRSVHVARKQHGGGILPGDRYCRTVQFGHYPEGAFTLRVSKSRLEKGPMWVVKEVMES